MSEAAEDQCQEEEEYVMHDPVLILMSTVRSLNRRWYSHPLPPRQYFERKVYPSLARKHLKDLELLSSEQDRIGMTGSRCACKNGIILLFLGTSAGTQVSFRVVIRKDARWRDVRFSEHASGGGLDPRSPVQLEP